MRSRIMKDQVSISVVMPAYNASRFIGESIESILNQTLKNFELIIVNDGSTDDTVDIVNSYNDPRIRLIHNPENLGIVATLNNGITEARSEFIARLDADDIAVANRLEEQLKYMLANPDVELLGTWAKTFTDNVHDSEDWTISNRDLTFNLLFFNPIIHSSVVFRKSTILREGMYRQNYAEDYDLWSRLLHKYKMYVLEQPLVFYRLTDVSLCRVVFKDECAIDAQKIALRNIRHYMGEGYELPDSVLDMLSDKLSTIRQTQDLSLMKRSIEYYDEITAAIIRIEAGKSDSMIKNLPGVVEDRRQKIINGYVKGLKLRAAFELCKGVDAMEIFNHQLKRRISKRVPILKMLLM